MTLVFEVNLDGVKVNQRSITQGQISFSRTDTYTRHQTDFYSGITKVIGNNALFDSFACM